MHERRWPGFSFYGVILLALIADQTTKAWAWASLEPFASVHVMPGLAFTFVRNTGIAFGFFSGHGWIVAVFMIGLAALAYYYSRGVNWRGWEPNIVGGCLVGGALGNLLDRSRLGFVIDFIDVYVGHHHWPTFNIADSLICLSVAWIVIRQLNMPETGRDMRRS